VPSFPQLLPPAYRALQAFSQMLRFSITLLHVLACLDHVLCLERQCYYPVGLNSTDTPCTDDPVSFCCPTGWACLGNRVCEYTPWSNTAYYLPFFRGSCTDPTWTSSACPLFCDSYPNATTGGQSDNIRKVHHKADGIQSTLRIPGTGTCNYVLFHNTMFGCVPPVTLLPT
jgi:hypothetical protein